MGELLFQQHQQRLAGNCKIWESPIDTLSNEKGPHCTKGVAREHFVSEKAGAFQPLLNLTNMNLTRFGWNAKPHDLLKGFRIFGKGLQL